MIRAALLLWLASALPLLAQTGLPPAALVPTDPYEVPGAVMQAYETEGEDAAYRLLDGAIRAARNEGRLSPDWGIAFAMLSDMLRNTRGNPAYALRIAEEGIALMRQGTAQDIRDSYLIEVSRAYALADLGRLDEAVEAATLALPAMREGFGDKAADDFAAYRDRWAAGQFSGDILTALDLARQALGRAEAASDRSDHVTVLTEAARARLPPGAGFDPAEVALLTAEAAALSGRALILLGRPDDARATLRAGAEAWCGPDWADLATACPPAPPSSQRRLAELFYWLGRSGLGTDRAGSDFALVDAALARGEAVEPGGPWLQSMLLVRMRSAQLRDDPAAAQAHMREAAARGRAAGEEDFARLAEFYGQMIEVNAAPDWESVDARALLAAARAAMAMAGRGSAVNPSFVAAETAEVLAEKGNYGMGLILMREAMGLSQIGGAGHGLAQGVSGGLAAEEAVRQLRERAELHMGAAYLLTEQRDRATGGKPCFDAPGRGCPYFEGAADVGRWTLSHE